jgi:folate-binding protein YgfZ
VGMHKHPASILLLQGSDVLPFLDGLSTNLVDGPCTTVFTNQHAKIIDVCDVIPNDNGVALIGHEANKSQLLAHLTTKILGQSITIRDISMLNDVFLSDENRLEMNVATVHDSFFGTMYVVPKAHEWTPTWTLEEWNNYRVDRFLPYHGYEITQDRHPLACGLESLVHTNKGCYVGQEIITRMRSRGRQGHKLARKQNPVEGATTVGQTQSLIVVRTQ